MRQTATRREFLTAAGVVAAAGCGQSAPEPARDDAPRDGMKLSLSVRVAEKFDNKTESSMTIDELIAVAFGNDCAALCLRASQAGVHSPPETVREISAKIHEAGLAVSMATGDFAIPQNNERGPEALRNITPYLDLAEAFHSDLLRMCLKTEEDIAWAQRASDEARERGVRLAHQSHAASLFETVEGSLDTLRKIGRPNFGLIYEPANWMIADEPYGKETIEKLREHIFNVYVQNHRLNPDAESVVNTWKRGGVGVDHIGLWEPGGVRCEEVFGALRDMGYTGYVTIHQAFEGVMTVGEAVRLSAEYLRPLISPLESGGSS